MQAVTPDDAGEMKLQPSNLKPKNPQTPDPEAQNPSRSLFRF